MHTLFWVDQPSTIDWYCSSRGKSQHQCLGKYTVRVKNREEVQVKLKEAGIPTAVHYPIPLNQHPAVTDCGVKLPEGDNVASQVISLPMYPYLKSKDVMTIVSQLVSVS